MDCDFFNELRQNGKLCDVIISIDGVEFKAHKIILCGCSSYFRALFTSACSNTEEKKVYNIDGVSSDIMSAIIEYAYTMSVSITEDNVEHILVAAHRFGVLDIVMVCCDFLETQLCLENCIRIYRLADLYSSELKHKAYRFILQNFEDIVKVSEEFLQLPASEFGEIIGDDELHVSLEDVVFEAIIKWIDNDPNNRKKYIPLLLSKARLALMDEEYFISNVKNNMYVKENDDCKSVIENSLKAIQDFNMNGPSTQDFTNQLMKPRLPDSILFAFGGFSGTSPTNIFEAYDARADMWVDVTSEGGRPSADHGTVYLKGYVYIIGGYDGMDFLNSVRRFDPVKKTWQEVAPMHSVRTFVSVTVLDNFIYAMGGFDGYDYLSTAERYDPETNQWSLISAMHDRRSHTSATTLHRKVYICGGFNGNECLLTAEMYNPETNQWTLIAPMRSRKAGMGVIAYGECVYVVGGFDGSTGLCSAEAYNPLTNTWHTISSMISPRSNFGLGVVEDLLFVVGGFGSDGFKATSSAECYDKKTNEWYEVRDMSVPRSCSFCA